MARRKVCVVERKRKGVGKRRKGGKHLGLNRFLFLCAVVIFGPIRITLFRVKHTISTFVSMQGFFDEQIIWPSGAKNQPSPFSQYFQNLPAVLRIYSPLHGYTMNAKIPATSAESQPCRHRFLEGLWQDMTWSVMCRYVNYNINCNIEGIANLYV